MRFSGLDRSSHSSEFAGLLLLGSDGGLVARQNKHLAVLLKCKAVLIKGLAVSQFHVQIVFMYFITSIQVTRIRRRRQFHSPSRILLECYSPLSRLEMYCSEWLALLERSHRRVVPRPNQLGRNPAR